MASSELSRYWAGLRKPLELELSRGCPDTAIVGTSIGEYCRRWAARLTGDNEEGARLAQSIARGLRDYAQMPVLERKRRVMAALDLLRQVEKEAAAPPPSRKRPPAPRRAAPAHDEGPAASDGDALSSEAADEKLMEASLDQLAPRARWPRLLADKLGIYTVRDLLYHIPRDWVPVYAISDLPDDARAAVVATVVDRDYERLKSRQGPRPLYKYILTVEDATGRGWVTSLSSLPARGKSPWSPAKLLFSPGQQVFVLGKVDRVGKLVDLHMEDIVQVTEAEAGALRPGAQVPLYPLTAGVFQNQIHRLILRILSALGTGEAANARIDPLPPDIREQHGLMPLLDALHEQHLPQRPHLHEEARRRLAFEEFLVPQLLMAGLRYQRHTVERAPAFAAREGPAVLVSRMGEFAPTMAQVRVLGEIEDDLRGSRPMNRLLQGDVGSGKTLVAAAALAFAAHSGYQAAIMAPTEILAEQLYLVLSRLLRPLEIVPLLLTGSVVGAERLQARAALSSGEGPLAVGTHALIQEDLEFKKLGLVIVDEQHRFGVLQRATLRAKGALPNALVMTATPIPRTLSLSAYGDLDLSVLDELPPGRHPVETRWLPAHALADAYDFVRGQVGEGRQAYVLCPLVEQSDLLQADAAVEMAEELQHRVFPELKVGLLHGRMRPEEKDAAMEAFRGGETHVLACTTVIEVGVDVPNATVILIHNAERFGLAQLHQLRGRVGRSSHPSCCYLITHPRFDPGSEAADEPAAARRRLRVMLAEQDGFAIAEQDLQLRGPGEYLGTRQSGLADFKIGSLLRDGRYLEQARRAAQEIIARDPELAAQALAELKGRVQRLKARVDQFRE